MLKRELIDFFINVAAFHQRSCRGSERFDLIPRERMLLLLLLLRHRRPLHSVPTIVQAGGSTATRALRSARGGYDWRSRAAPQALQRAEHALTRTCEKRRSKSTPRVDGRDGATRCGGFGAGARGSCLAHLRRSREHRFRRRFRAALSVVPLVASHSIVFDVAITARKKAFNISIILT